jgi:hypothetical protein
VIGGLLRARRAPATTLLPVSRITSGALELGGAGTRVVLECSTLAFGIKGDAEQRAIVDGWSALLNSLPHPLGVVIRSRAVDPATVAPLPAGTDAAALRSSYARLLGSLASERRAVDRRVFVVVPHDPPVVRRGPAPDGREALEQRVRWIAECLRRLDLEPRRLDGHELVALLRTTLDPTATAQPVSMDDPLCDVGSLLAPAAVAERPAMLQIGERLARTLVVVGYPARLHPGWLSDLHAWDGDLDVALHVAPSPAATTMAFLERRIAELSSTISAAEARGARADAYRRVALADALELRDRVAQGSERLFDLTLLATVWADDPAALDAQTRGLEALLGQRLIHTRRLLFQMRAGLVSTLPLGQDQVRTRRVLPTSALAATFPFTGGDLRSERGLLYGIAVSTRGPVVLDRFALENHNAVVFATSGAGKSFLVKCEMTRAMLAGVRVLVIDPEGEYAQVAGALGAEVVPVGPGAACGRDPFAVCGTGAGALAARIAALRTLVGLLVGGLGPAADAAVDAALAQAYEGAGFRGDESDAGRRPPTLGDVAARLGARAQTAELAERLARYTAGSASWLLRAGGATRVGGASRVYTLAGLPEEERVAAMFLVLDEIWSELADATRPTLVVVDEAWWLMRSIETSRFLVRLVKTARKRRAGLTLVTQDLDDVLAHPDGAALVSNAALQILLRSAPQSLPALAELFRLTRAEQSFLLTAARGEALLIAGSRRVPVTVIASDEETHLITGARA